MTQLKDVIHFYLWQDLRIYDKATAKWSAWKKLTPKVLDYVLQSEMTGFLINFEMQLSLRRLDSMTEEELNERMRLANKWSPFEGTIQCAAEQTAYLLSRGFDLFSLIDSNQAIDKNKITTP